MALASCRECERRVSTDAKVCPGCGAAEPAGGTDSLFREAAEVCIQNQTGSPSLLQRRLGVDIDRAKRIVEQLHRAGVLGPADGPYVRDVLVEIGDLDRICAIAQTRR